MRNRPVLTRGLIAAIGLLVRSRRGRLAVRTLLALGRRAKPRQESECQLGFERGLEGAEERSQAETGRRPRDLKSVGHRNRDSAAAAREL